MRVRTTWMVVLALLLAGAVALTRTNLGDYGGPAAEDNAAPTLAALVRGDLESAARDMPAMGLTSLIVRAPGVAAAGDGLLAQFRLGSLACLLALVALLAVMDRRMVRDQRPLSYRAALWGACLLGPITLAPLDAGHAEEILGAALCTAALLAATSRRAVTAGLLLGLAIGCKQWAIVAAPIVLVAVDTSRVLGRDRLLATSAAVLAALAMIVPGIAANPDRYRAVTSSLTSTQRVYPQSLWWPIAERRTTVIELGGGERRIIRTSSLPLGLTRGLATGLAVLVALALALALLRGRFADPLAALASALMLRCALDPMNLDYYAAPALLAIAAWDAGARAPRSRLPLATVASSGGVLLAWSLPQTTAPVVLFAAWLASLGALLLMRTGASRPVPSAA